MGGIIVTRQTAVNKNSYKAEKVYSKNFHTNDLVWTTHRETTEGHPYKLIDRSDHDVTSMVVFRSSSRVTKVRAFQRIGGEVK